MVVRTWLLACALAPALVAPGWGQDSGEPAPPHGVRVPDESSVAALLAALPADVEPAVLAAPWPAWSDGSEAGWGAERPWRRWVELVRAEAAAPAPDPARRAELALLARLQGRDAEAWAHLEACAARPDVVAALLPAFVPGAFVPGALGPGPQGALPDGALLAPALPPAAAGHDGLRWLVGNELECTAFEVGAARAALRVKVSRDGLEVSLRHLGGGAARVVLEPPLPRGVDAGILFVDWEKRPPGTRRAEVVLDAEASEHVLWLTFRPPEELWPRPDVATLGASAGERAVVVVAGADDAPRQRRFAEALGELLGVPAAVRDGRGGLPPGPEALVLRLDEPDAGRRLADYIGAAEAFALRRAVR